MGEWRHRLSAVDREADTARCSTCGPTRIVYRKDSTLTRQTPRCAVGIAESKDRSFVQDVRTRWAGLPGGLTITIERPRKTL